MSNLLASNSYRLKKILNKLKITTIIVTHDSYEAFYLGSKCGIIINQELKQFDDPYKVYHFPNSVEVVNFLNRGILIPAKVTGKNTLESWDLGTIEGNFIKNYPEGVSPKTLQYAVNLAIYPLHVRRIRIDKKTLKMAVRNNLALRLLTTLKYLKPGYSQQTKARRSHHNMSEFVLHTELGAGYCKSFHKHFNAWLEKFEPAQPERTCQPTPSQMVPGTEHNAGSHDPSS